MKTAAILATTLALAASSPSQAALTTHNATYDFFTVSVFELFGSAAEIVLTKESPWLITAVDEVLTDVEAQLALGEHKFPYYADRFDAFVENATAHDNSFKSLADEYVAFDLSLPSLLGYSGRPYLDAVFETVESFLPTLKNATVSEWHMRERQAMEKRVLNGTSTGLLAVKLDEYLMVLSENEQAGIMFDVAMSSLYERAAEEYEIPSSDDADAEEEEATGSH